MKTPSLTITTGLFSFALFTTALHAADPKLEEAVQAAYERGRKVGYAEGYAKGLDDGKKPGVIGHRPEEYVLGSRQGGSTSGHEPPPIYRFRGADTGWVLEMRTDATARQLSSEQLNQNLRKNKQTEGTIVIESVPLNDLAKLQEAMKQIGGKQMVVAPK